jgi:hypothetical protein
MNCPACGTELVRRSRARLFITGLLFMAGALATVLLLHLLPAMLIGICLAVFGVSFLTSAVKSKGLWCRSCKRFPQ